MSASSVDAADSTSAHDLGSSTGGTSTSALGATTSSADVLDTSNTAAGATALNGEGGEEAMDIDHPHPPRSSDGVRDPSEAEVDARRSGEDKETTPSLERADAGEDAEMSVQKEEGQGEDGGEGEGGDVGMDGEPGGLGHEGKRVKVGGGFISCQS